ncbi:MAG: hypothetical protein OEV99_09185 [Nitrospira sp.]|nr:hypothetical protein [Nitrospira sp.]MDH4370009.1 hypothetical protein [Nitrospira sp.]MDH5347637.1 hypothetical protein [Nitrospira sp.]MDH5497757.1 hypothetical protein [Nitrospira sp.]MDH5724473.1 hypothetical protein [Nitrospira sp.]
MRRSTSNENQAMNRLDVKRLRELEQENDLLKLLYTDLLQKFSAMKDGLVRGARAC